MSQDPTAKSLTLGAILGVGLAAVIFTVMTVFQNPQALTQPTPEQYQQQYLQRQQQSRQAEVYTACQDSRLQQDGYAEEVCGQLQDEYGMEYVCQEANRQADNLCHVDVLPGEAPSSQESKAQRI